MIEIMGLERMGEIIRIAREERGESQDILSDRAGVSQGWLSQVELGHVSNPSAARIRQVAKALAMDARLLFAAEFDIPYEGESSVMREIPDDPIAIAEQIAALTARLAQIASLSKARAPARSQRTSVER
jgi:transcriptional regulator with XRE-family HTH domain